MESNEFALQSGSNHSFIAMFSSEVLECEEGFARGPERALLSALLFDGIQAYVNYVLAPTKKIRNRYSEAYHWVMYSKNDYPFSFVPVCDALGINPEYLKFGLANASTSLLAEIGKSRRHS